MAAQVKQQIIRQVECNNWNHQTSQLFVLVCRQVHEFSVEMTCEGCSTAVQNVLKKKTGVCVCVYVRA